MDSQKQESPHWAGFLGGFRDILRHLETGIWSERLDSNQRPSRPERDALPSCATLRVDGAHSTEKLLAHKGLAEKKRNFFRQGKDARLSRSAGAAVHGLSWSTVLAAFLIP